MKKTVTTNIKTAFFLLTFLSAWVVSGGCWADGADTCGTSVSHARQLSYEYIASYPHDTTAFTQGLVMHGGYLYESTGQLGTSTLRKLEIKTGTILKQYYIGKKYFAEGLTVSGDSLVHLTWKYGRAFIYDINSFKPSGNFDYEGEGWGIVAMKDGLLVSDGSATLKVLNRSGQLLRAISVHDDGQPVEGLNEMEIVGDMLFANVWPTNCIAAINPSSGELLAWLNLFDLYPAGLKQDSTSVLNGIAYSPERQTLFVTGKNWPVVHEIRILDAVTQQNRYAKYAH